MRFVKIPAASAVISLLGLIPPLTGCSSTSGEEGTTDEQSIQPAVETDKSKSMETDKSQSQETDKSQSQETDDCVATVYAGTNFEGNQLCLPAGTFTRAELEARGFTEKSIRSLTLDPGFRVRVVTDAACRHYESASPTSAIALPGKVSSIIIDACAVGLFDGEDAQGAGTCLGVGRYDADALTRLGLEAGSTHSVSVAPGYVLQLERTDGKTSTTDVLEFESGPLSDPGRKVISAHVLAKPESPYADAPLSDEAIARILRDAAAASAPGSALGAPRFSAALAAATPEDRPDLKSFKHVYLLGDSLTDQTKAFDTIRGLWCPNPAYGYWNGRFTNGRNWVDYFQEAQQLTGLDNRAVGGSKVLKSAVWRPSLMQQAQEAVGKTPKEERLHTLVFLWSGPNDINEAAQAQQYQGGTEPAKENGWKFGYEVGNGVVQVMNYLRREGIEHLVVADLPPLDLVPVVRTPPYTEDPRLGIGKDRVTYLGSAVAGANFLIVLHATVNKEVLVPQNRFITSYIKGEVQNPVMPDVHDACQVLGNLNACTPSFLHDYIDKPCPGKMFMDQLHPTSLAHCGLKRVFEEAMFQAGYTGIEFRDCGPRT
ncbi:SGNH/GDSL hydrolase family protein [Polyangium aurulentum]|uniref:SGNH/GDSL hydrolase family protein n=1 Tax=Polyangium aurulentum TaxID=2567896 RepID=UPI0010AE09B2|nr:SGNH/GDSL hydrolase family protein [Polyangium aurulentum]UQA59923.1 hypothetical protein E8A73_005370 [Polyangium aurulentum]